MNANRRYFLQSVTIATAATSFGQAWAQAASSATKPVTLVVPFAPGGNVDVAARLVATPMSKILGQPVLVENRPGASGAVAAAHVARAAADGHTLLVGNPGQLATLPLINKTSYTAANFKAVGLISRTSLLLVVNAQDKRLMTFAEFRRLAESKPGLLNAANPGNGSPNHLGMVQLERGANLKVNAIGYRGSAPALTDLVGGQIDAHFDQVTSSLPFIKAGSIRALAVLGPTRDPALADVPTLSELGVPGIDATTYVGVFAPSGVPAGMLSTLGAALSQAVQASEIAARLAQLGSQAHSASGEVLAQLVAAEGKTSALLLKEGRLTLE